MSFILDFERKWQALWLAPAPTPTSENISRYFDFRAVANPLTRVSDRDTVVPFHEIWSVEYFLRFAIKLWIFIDVRQHYFQLRSSCETDIKKK